MIPIRNSTVTSPLQGEQFFIAGGVYRIIISGAQTSGRYAVIEMEVPPGAGPGPHVHPDFLETFYVLEGEVKVFSESGGGVASKGSFIQIPLDGPVHCFKNQSAETARLLCTVMPAGLDEFFRRVGTPVADDTIAPPAPGPDLIEKMRSLAAEFGMKLYPPDFFATKTSSSSS